MDAASTFDGIWQPVGQGTTSPTSAPTIVNPPQQKDPQNRKGDTPEHLQESAAGTLVCFLHKAPFPTSGNVTNQIYINEKRIRKNEMSKECVLNKGKRHNPQRRTKSGGHKQSL